MRKIAEIRKDIEAKMAEVKAIDVKEAEAVTRGKAELDTLIAELNAANAIEKAEQAEAERKFNQMQEKAGRKFSIVKFLRELSEGKGLTGLEAEVAEMGAQEYSRMGFTQQGVVIPVAALRAAGTRMDCNNRIFLIVGA